MVEIQLRDESRWDEPDPRAEGNEEERGTIYVDGNWAGEYHVFYDRRRKTMGILWLGVRQEYRHMGIGREVFNKLAFMARKQGLKRVELEARDEDAMAFWNRVGFSTVLGTDVMMERVLRRPNNVRVRSYRRRR